MAALQKSLLEDLEINDIKKELEKRNLDITGVRSVLVDRLNKAIIKEGKDPSTFYFDVMDAAGNTSELTEADEEVVDLANETIDDANDISAGGEYNSDQGEISTVSHFGEIGGIDAVQGNMPGEGKENGSQGKRNANASSASQDCDRQSAAKTNTDTSNITTPAKGRKSQSSVKFEGGDESFVVQEDDVVLNDIDSDLLDGGGEAADSGNEGEAGIYEDANNGELDSAATTDASLLENTHGDQAAAGSKDGKDTSEAKSSAQPVKKDEKTSQAGRNLWVSGLFSNTRATDLKTLFNKHGKVIAAKVVTNARSPASRWCFGLVTLSSADDATKCIQQLNRVPFRGRRISIERAQTEIQGAKEKILPPSGLRTPAKTPGQPTKKADEHHSRTSINDPDNKDKKRDEAKVKADEVRDRLRRKEQFLEREKYKQRMIERKQWEEAQKIERERRRLREMREELERRQIETERLRLETERLHMEKEQEKYRKQQRAFQERRALKRHAQREEEWPNKQPANQRFHGGEGFRENRDFSRRVEVRRKFREERPPPREGRLARDDRAPRAPPRNNNRSEWKSERGTWNGPVANSKVDDGWAKYEMGHGDGWDNGVVLSQSGGNYAVQQGQMMSSSMGTGTVFIAQPAIQTSSVMMHNNGNRQSDGRFGMAAASVRRY